MTVERGEIRAACLVEVTEDLATSVLAASLLVIHDTSGGGEDNITELTGREKVVDPLLEIAQLNVEAGRDDTALVDATNELDDNLARTVVVDLLELADVTMTLHDGQELNNHLGGGTDENLALTALLGVVDALKAIVEDRDADHGGKITTARTRVVRKAKHKGKKGKRTSMSEETKMSVEGKEERGLMIRIKGRVVEGEEGGKGGKECKNGQF